MSNLSRCLIAVLCVALAVGPAIAQEPEAGAETGPKDEIETDRDSFTPATTTAGFGRAIFESSYTFIDNRSAPDGHSFPEALLRVGVWDRLELRVGWNYEAGGPTSATSGVDFGAGDSGTENESKILYGAKFETTRESGWIPQSALIVQGDTPTSGPSNFTRITVGEVAGWTLPNGWKWDSAIRFGTNNENGDNFTEWAPSTVLKIPIGESWSVHAEYFGILSAGRAETADEHFASFGFHYLINKNIEIGDRFGFGLTEESPRFFNNVGIGWRF